MGDRMNAFSTRMVDLLGSIPTRLACFVFAFVAFAYAQAMLGGSIANDRLYRIAAAIEEGGAIVGLNGLDSLIGRRDDERCAGERQRHLAVVRAAITNGATEADLLASLGCRPADGLVWELLAEHRAKDADLVGTIEAMQQSRRFAPREGNVVVRRQFTAWFIYDLLPVDDKDATLDEFALLVEGRYFPEALAIIREYGAERPEEFGDAMITVSLLSRQLFAQYLYPRSSSVEVPGIARPRPR